VLGVLPVGQRPRGITFDGTYVWVANQEEGTVAEFRASDASIIRTAGASAGNPPALAFDGANVWVSGDTMGKL
jgi:DNA-binding beta-propeller fold protein YncE